MAHLFFYTGDGTTIVHDLEHDATTIGRHPKSIVMLTHDSVSGHHAVIRKHGSKFYIQDLGSSNGTQVNGAQIEEANLNDGDRVRFGDMQAVFYTDNSTPVIKTQPLERSKTDVPKVTHSAPLQAQAVAPEKKNGGCFSIIGKVVVALFLLGFVGNLMETCSKNNVVNPSSDSVQAEAKYSACRQFGQLANNLALTKFSSESERCRFAVERASEIARTPNVDHEFLAFAHSCIEMFAKLQAAYQNFETEVQNLTNKAEIAASLAHLYGLQQTQNRSGGELAELIARMGLAQDQQRELQGIIAKHEPVIVRLQTEFMEALKEFQSIFDRLKQRYPAV